MHVLGIDRRVHRLRVSGRFFLLALDHGLPAGPVRGIERPADLLRSLRGVPFSGTIANPGIVRFIAEELPPERGLVVHLSAGTLLGPRPTSKVVATTVERAVSLGADAVSVQISFGDREEDRMLTDAGRVMDEASSLGIPVLIMAYAATEAGESSGDSGAAAHAARAAAEIGASILQTDYVGDPEGVREIVRGCPMPVVLAGGPRSPSEDAFLDSLRAMMADGLAGVSVGRRVFQSANPAATARRIADVVFEAERPMIAEGTR